MMSVRVAMCAAVLLGLGPRAAGAQDLRGRVVEEETGFPVPLAAVYLLDPGFEEVSSVLADTLGAFVIRIPRAGEYHLRAERIGYRRLETHLVRVEDDRDYDLDLVVAREPIVLEPLEVTVHSDVVSRFVRRTLGMDPASVSGKVVGGSDLDRLRVPGRDIVSVLRWANLPAMVQYGKAGVCVRSLRLSMHPCARVFLDDVPLRPEFVETVDPESLGAVVYLREIDSAVLFGAGYDQSGGGVLLLFTRGYLASG